MYYIEQNEQILLFDKDKQKLENSLTFMPQYAGLEIKETERPIVEFQFADTKEYKHEQEQKERERISKLSLTKREVFLALYKAKGITPDMIKEQISDSEALIEFEYANEYFRGNPLIDLIGEKLGYTSDDLDYLFQNKQLPEKEEPEPEPTETEVQENAEE